MKRRGMIGGHIRANGWQYGMLTLILLLGWVLGGSRALGSEPMVAADIIKQLAGTQLGPDMQQQIFLLAWWNQARVVLVLGFLGLTVIGLPFIPVVLFLKAYALGFSLILLLQAGGDSSTVAILLGMVPHNLLYFIFLLWWSVMAMNFSLYLINRGKRSPSQRLGPSLMQYGLMLFMVLLGLAIGALVELGLIPLFLSGLPA